MIRVNGSYPEQFDKSVIDAIEGASSQAMDDRIKTLIIDKKLLVEFTNWIDVNQKWAKKHTVLVHDLMMLSLSKGNFSSIDVIEEIVCAIWGLPASATWRLQDDISCALAQNNRLSLCLALFRYLERASFVDMDITKEGFEKLSKDEQTGFVHLSNLYHQNIFHLCAEKNRPEAFDLFFQALPSPEVLNDENSYRRGPLNLAIVEARNPEMVKKILKVFGKTERMQAVKTLLASSRVLHGSMHTNEGIEVIKAIFRSIPKNDRLEVIGVRDHYDLTILDYAVTNGLTKAGKEVVRILPSDDRLYFLKMSPQQCQFPPPLHLAARLGEVNLFNDISNLLSKTDQVKIRLFCDKQGQNVLHNALCSTNEHLIKAVLKPMPDTFELDELILTRNHEGKTSLHEAAIRIRVKAMRTLLDQIPGLDERKESMD